MDSLTVWAVVRYAAEVLALGGSLIALYMANAQKRKVEADTSKTRAETDRTDAGTATDLMEEIRATAKDVREMIKINADCMREKADEEVKRIRAEGEVERQKDIAEGYRLDSVEKEKLIADLNGQIRKLKEGQL